MSERLLTAEEVAETKARESVVILVTDSEILVQGRVVSQIDDSHFAQSTGSATRHGEHGHGHEHPHGHHSHVEHGHRHGTSRDQRRPGGPARRGGTGPRPH